MADLIYSMSHIHILILKQCKFKQMSTVHSKHKWIGLAITILLEDTFTDQNNIKKLCIIVIYNFLTCRPEEYLTRLHLWHYMYKKLTICKKYVLFFLIHEVLVWSVEWSWPFAGLWICPWILCNITILSKRFSYLLYYHQSVQMAYLPGLTQIYRHTLLTKS